MYLFYVVAAGYVVEKNVYTPELDVGCMLLKWLGFYKHNDRKRQFLQLLRL